MPSSASSNLRLELQANGENSTTWGTKTNTNLELIEDALTAMATVAMTDGATATLSSTNYAADEARAAILKATGAGTIVSTTIQIPSVTKTYVVWNALSAGAGAGNLLIKTSGGAALTIAKGYKATVFCDGTDVKFSGVDKEYVDAAVAGASVTGPLALTGNTTSPILALTQSGAGPVLRASDVAGDTTFFEVGTAGNVCIGHSGADTRFGMVNNVAVDNADSYAYLVNGTYGSGTDVDYLTCYGSIPNVTAGATITALYHHVASQGTFGAGASVPTQFGYYASNTLTGATNNYGFGSEIAAGTNRWNFVAIGTANNAYAGKSKFGALTAPTYEVDVEGVASAFNHFDKHVAMGATTVDLTAGALFTKTITGALSLTITNAPASGTVATFILETTSAGAYAITLASGTLTVPGGGGLTTGAGAVDVFAFYSFDGGSNWRGFKLSDTGMG